MYIYRERERERGDINTNFIVTVTIVSQTKIECYVSCHALYFTRRNTYSEIPQFTEIFDFLSRNIKIAVY